MQELVISSWKFTKKLNKIVEFHNTVGGNRNITPGMDYLE